MKPQKVVVMDDVFRSATNGLEAHPSSALYLRSELQTALSFLQCDQFSVAYLGGNPAADVILDGIKLMDALDLKPSTDSWFRLHGLKSTEKFEAALEEYFKNTAVVFGWELPNCIFEALTNLDVPVIDLSLSPLRFSADLSFQIRSNRHQFEILLRSHALEVRELSVGVSLLRTFSYQDHEAISKLADLGRVGIMAGQSAVDTSLITADGNLFDLSNSKHDIEGWARSVDAIIYKPHPIAPGPDHFAILNDVGKPIFDANWSSYALCVVDTVKSVLAISSGLLDEAPYFDCHPVRLHTPLRRTLNPCSCDMVQSSVLHYDAIGAILGIHQQRAKPLCAGVTLREIFGSWAQLRRPRKLELRKAKPIRKGRRLFR